jgi:hypothetical protein
MIVHADYSTPLLFLSLHHHELVSRIDKGFSLNIKIIDSHRLSDIMQEKLSIAAIIAVVMAVFMMGLVMSLTGQAANAVCT